MPVSSARSSRGARAVAIATAILAAGAAHAAPLGLDCASIPSVDRASAEAQSAFSAERYEEAAEKYAAVHACTKDPSLLFNLAKADEHLGRWVEAKAAMTQFLASATGLSEDVRQAAKDELATIGTHVGSVTVRADVVGAKVSIDGASAVDAPAGPIDHLVGKVHVEVSAPGRETYRRDFDLAGGASLEVEASLPEGSETPPGARPPPPVWMWIGYGVAGAGAIVGAITGGVSASMVSDIRDRCAGDLCPKSTEPDRETANDLANASNVSLAIGGAGAILGVVGTILWATAKPAAAPAAALRLGPTGITLAGTF